jgi:hypothetical protein
LFTEHLDRARTARYEKASSGQEVSMRTAPVTSSLNDIPVDFLADPDGRWEYEELALVAGFDEAWGRLSIGALTEPYAGFPEGAALVMLTTADHCAIALVDCLAPAEAELRERHVLRNDRQAEGRERVAA